MYSVNELRDAILAARFETSNFGEMPQPDTLYIPFQPCKGPAP